MSVKYTLSIIFFSIGILILASCDTTESPRSPIQEEVITESTEPANDRGEQEVNYDGPGRYGWQRPNLIIGLLGRDGLSEKTVVDIGAGAGFFTLRLAPLAKKVIALDINQKLLNMIDSIKVIELSPDIQQRLETRLTPRDAPNLENNEVDAVLIVNTFMFIENKLDYLKKLKRTIKSGGRIVVVDFKRKRTDLGPQPRKYRLPLYEIEDLFYEAGYRNIQAIDTELKYQYILMADK